ncbi:BglG family transcription antiterminator [Niallia sp. 03133]|uniref:BglG family transcription antiterminator n=1 Tax=Niallia sp. 03133 TaxID=3458060 RepID=UPI004044A6A2
MDNRSIRLLEEVLAFPGIKVKTLELQLHLSRSQVNYSLQKVNEWLVENGLEKVQNNRKTGLKIDRQAQKLLPVQPSKKQHSIQIPTEIDRVYLICILLLSRTEELSLFHLADALGVSRNTVLKNLKKAEGIAEKYKVSVRYNRRTGYFMEGFEFNKRYLLMASVQKLFHSINGVLWVQEIAELSSQEIDIMRKRLEKVEKRLNVKFTDERMQELPFSLLLLLKRISMGKRLENHEHLLSDLTLTREYNVVGDLVWGIAEIEQKDRLFICLQLLAANVIEVEKNLYNDKIILDAVKEMLTAFENNACIRFHDRSMLESKLLQHLKPAIYRIKYGLTLENPLLEEIRREHADVHQLVIKSSAAIERLVEKKMEEDEIAYLTLLIKSWMYKYGDEIPNKWKAVVVCPNGISVSKLLLESLKDLFPQIIFLEHVSIREFEKYHPFVDIVFSTVSIPTKKKFFYIKPFLNSFEKRELQQRVIEEIHGCRTSFISLESLLPIIEKHTHIMNAYSLKKELRELISGSQGQMNTKTTEAPTLKEVLKKESIQFFKKVSSWEEAISLAAQPLVKNQDIEEKYVHAMIEKFDPEEPYIIIAPKVALPHASPEEGVHQIAMSLLVLEEGIEFSPGLQVWLVFVMAAVDRKKHLKALFQLNELVNNEDQITRILHAKTADEVYSFIKESAQLEVDA